MTKLDPELQPLAYEAVTGSYKAQVAQARRDAQAAPWATLPGMLPGVLQAAAWLIAVAAISAGFILWPRGYDASEAPMAVAISYTIGGLIAALLLGAVGRIIQLLEVIAAKRS
jgi:hypothetical protein